jgi:hypothetical protein
MLPRPRFFLRSLFAPVLLGLILGIVTPQNGRGQSSTSGAPSVEKLTVFRPAYRRGTEPVACWVARFREADFELVVIDNGPTRSAVQFRGLPDRLSQHGCVLGTNGGFFDVGSFRPNGLMIADGKSAGAFDPKNWAAGVLAVRRGVLMLADQTRFTPDATVTQLLQTGPWLVREGRSQWGFQNDSPARRTFIATDGTGVWVLGHVGGCTLLELSILLTSPEIKKILTVREALNLDGGPSSGLWVQGHPSPIYIEENTVVRNYVGIRPRTVTTVPVR